MDFFQTATLATLWWMSSVAVPEPPPPPPPSTPGASLDFLRPFTYVFDDPRWLTKVLIGGLFVLASSVLIGVFFILGYCAKLARNVIAGVQYPLPEWDDLGNYFAEGVKLFLVILAYSIPVILIVGVMVIPAIFAGAADNDTARAFAGMSASCIWCAVFPLSLALAAWLPGALTMAVVSQSMGAAFEFGHIWTYIRANVGNYVLAVVIWLVARFAASLGFILLCVGVFFTGFLAYVIGTYAFGVVYRLATVK